MAWRIAVDTGGTFTDVVAFDETSGAREVLKVPSTPRDPSDALGRGVRELTERLGVGMDEVSTIMHGTTAATNAILEADYAPMGLIVTRGFRDILEVRRQDVPGDFGDITWWIKPERVVPLELVREVEGRFDHTGAELRPLDEDAIRAAAREYRAAGIAAVAVSFLHSYRNPAHERRCAELIREEHPEAHVSLSSDVIREYREYERTLGTCLNTGLMPLMSSYIARIEERVSGEASPRLYVMKSSGGVATAGELVTRPIASVLSGPAAGVIGAAAIGQAEGVPDLLTLDVGGTSADIALIEGSLPRILNEGRIEDHDVKVPMIDMTTVGAGGGSIAWIAGSGALRVGPRSAGSTPGPVCYGRGGEDPTTTDAQLVLGRIPASLVGGAIRLDADAAARALTERIARPLGVSLERAAAGILELAVANMAGGIRVVSVRRGRDPRAFALFPFGGAGAMFACPTADALGITRILVPPSPGTTSAEGLLYADVRVDHARTSVQRADQLDAERFAAELDEVLSLCRDDLERQGFSGVDVRFEAHLELRYAGQAFEVRVPLALDRAPADALASAIGAFHAAHDDRYGFSYEGQQPVEVVNVAAVGFGGLRRPVAEPSIEATEAWDGLRIGEQPFYDATRSTFIDCAHYRRPAGRASGTIDGPAVIEQYDTTTVVDPGWTARTTVAGSLLLERAGSRGVR